MRYLLFLSILIAPPLEMGCVSMTPEEQEAEAWACKESLVLDEDGTTRKRTQEESDRDCGKLFEEYYKRLDRDMMRERGKPQCPEGYILICQGFSCGHAPRSERDLQDYTCTSRDDLRRQLGQWGLYR
jgi:hypothetical protein